jgi:EAL domain-containing protein (putative c-di-GMP-specific phosphodiesterase class I)
MQSDKIDKTSSVLLPHTEQGHGCPGCNSGSELEIQFEFAFQSIVSISTQSIYAHEALVRGLNGEPSDTVLSRLTDQNRYSFDQACRVKAVSTAAQLRMQAL